MTHDSINNTATDCKRCSGQGWVCEDHDDRVWYGVMPDGHERCCPVSAGKPCPDCNPCDRDNPPRMQPGFKTVFDKDGWRH